jgi:hypothetical protein
LVNPEPINSARLIEGTSKACIRLSRFENAVVYFFSSLPFISSYCPCILHVKPFFHTTRPFWLITPVFRETCSAVNWFAFCGFKRHCSRFAAISTFNFKHPFLGHIDSPLYAWIEKNPVIRQDKPVDKRKLFSHIGVCSLINELIKKNLLSYLARRT